MSTPQGPNGNGQGQPGRKPEDRNGQEVSSASSGAAPSQGPAPQGASSQDRAPQDRAPQQERSPQNTAADKPAGSPQSGGPVGQSAPSKPAEVSGKAPEKARETPKSEGKGPAAGTAKPAQREESVRSESQVRSEEPRQAAAAPQPEAPKANQGAGNQSAGNQGTGNQGGAPSGAATAQSSQGGDQSRSARPANQTARPGGQTPPWQRGQQGTAQGGSSPQKTPQTNLPGVGPGLGKSGPAAGGGSSASRPSTGGQPPAGKPAAAQNPAPSTRPVVTGTAAAAMNSGNSGSSASATRTTNERASNDRAAAKAKAAVIDGPTRHIERKDLAKDLPDLSAVKHPTPVAPATGETPKVGPTAIAPAPAGVDTGDALRATVQVRRIDPWSMLKISSVISVSLFFVWMIAVGLLYAVLAGMGVWDRLNSAFTDIVSDAGSEGLVTVGQVFGYATVIGLANMVLMTALATLGAFIYNLCTDLVGGVQVTLADPD
ncbi:hypothetical protein HF877_09405 [Rhodococcus sp. BL-253-APC-6A1W]|uniref:DUF3566 domain-containing protein n=1 Tax=Rhodococcus sp. BL-253-APC-6A1W TaxID=2725307 RepID=UPI00146CBE7D|nr:hypothetical protein [Rhodococcus sp. BL-253-APC-6A1W]